jgi:hypothetical protein
MAEHLPRRPQRRQQHTRGAVQLPRRLIEPDQGSTSGCARARGGWWAAPPRGRRCPHCRLSRSKKVLRRVNMGGVTRPQPDVTVVVLRALESLTSALSVKRSTRLDVCPRMSAGRILRCPVRQSLTLAAA